AVAVHGTPHHVSGLGSLDGDFRRFQIANLAHHDDVRILSQEGAQGLGEVHAVFGVDVDLVDAFQVDFHRVFCGGNIDVRSVEDVQAGIKRHRLARAGGAGYQDHALWLLEGCQV